MFCDRYHTGIFTLIGTIILSILLVGCQLVKSSPNRRDLLNWKYSDLKLIDPIDAVNPDQDLIAVYARKNDQSLQLRIDFLDLEKYFGKDIYIPIDTNPGGETQIIAINKGHLASDISWDYLIKITNSGETELIDYHYSRVVGLHYFIEYDAEQDRMVIDVIRSRLPFISGQAKFQVIITPPGGDEILDKSETFSIDTPSPARAKVLFAFWNTFSSATPAQTLRSWTGAHAGSMSNRHGLKYLIDAADRSNSTIFLLDLTTPNNLSALDYLNVLPQIRKLAYQGILGLPVAGTNNEVVTMNSSSPWVIKNDFVNIDLESTHRFILFMNSLLYVNSNLYDLGDIDYAHISRKPPDCDLLPINIVSSPPQNKFPLDCKILLLSYIYDPPSTPLVFGGDFSKSMLGDPAVSTQAFSYIANHPWIQVLTIQDLETSYESTSRYLLLHQYTQSLINHEIQQSASISAVGPNQSKAYDALLKAPHNQLTDLAWQVYYSILESSPSRLLSLRENYIGQVGLILAAADWANAPSDIQTCTLDLDFDGVNECIMSNKHIFVVIERDGGYIPFVFALDSNGIHQIIGPTWQFIIGLSDPSSWNTELGVRSDPSQILGVFQDNFNSWNYYNFSILERKIELYNSEMTMRKSFSIYPTKIHIALQNVDPSKINPSIPLVVDPWQRYTPHWGDSYSLSDTPSGLKWGIIHSEMVEVSSTNPVTAFAFNATHKALMDPEDPNFDYTRGHYLPFPMAIAEITDSGTYSVDIAINPK